MRDSSLAFLSDWMEGPGLGFDAPHTAIVSYASGGSGVGFLGVPPVEEESNIVSQVEEVLSAARDGSGAHIRFSFQLCTAATVEWTAMLVGRCLYLKPGETLPDGSKEAFVALLQYAEEVLKCSHIYACFKRSSAAVRGLVRTFQFLGFAPVEAADHRAPTSRQFVSLVYEIDDCDDDTDSLEDDDEDHYHHIEDPEDNAALMQ